MPGPTLTPTDSAPAAALAQRQLRPWRRLALASVALVLEFLVVSQWFDAQALGGWRGLGTSLGSLGPALLGALAALVLLARGEDWHWLNTSLGSAKHRPWPVALLVNLSGYGVLLWSCSELFAGRPATAPSPLAFGAFALGLFGVTLGFGWLGFPRGWFTAAVGRYPVPLLVAGLLGGLTWVVGLWARLLWEPFSGWTLRAVAWLLAALGQPVGVELASRDLWLADFAVRIAPECSGFEGIGLVTVMTLGYALRFRRELRFPQALLLWPLGIVAVLAGNVTRIAALVAVGAYLSPEIAQGGFHGRIGWVFFCAITLVLLWLARGHRFFSASAQLEQPEGRGGEVVAGSDRVAALLWPLVALLGTGLLTGLFVEDFDWLYPVKVCAVGAVLYHYRERYRPLLAGAFSPGSLAVGALIAVMWGGAAVTLDSGSSHPVPGPDALPGAYRWLWLGFRGLGSVVTVPLAEELAFRGFLMPRLISRDVRSVELWPLPVWAWLLSSVAFGLLHSHWVLGMLAGLAYGLLYARTGRLGRAVVAHAVTNLLLALYVAATGQWWIL